jgi:hypothetical protein
MKASVSFQPRKITSSFMTIKKTKRKDENIISSVEKKM